MQLAILWVQIFSHYLFQINFEVPIFAKWALYFIEHVFLLE